MKLVCPACGCAGDAAAFASDASYKEALALTVKLPKAVQDELVPYLRLFAPEKRSLTGPRTARLVRDLAALVSAGDVTGLDRAPPRPCTPALWAEGMRQMADRKGGHKAHFTNHNYLRALVYDLADRADAKREAANREAEAKHKTRASELAKRAEAAQEAQGLTPAAREALSAIRGLIKRKAIT